MEKQSQDFHSFNPQHQELVMRLLAELSEYSRPMKAGAFNLFGSAHF